MIASRHDDALLDAVGAETAHAEGFESAVIQCEERERLVAVILDVMRHDARESELLHRVLRCVDSPSLVVAVVEVLRSDRRDLDDAATLVSCLARNPGAGVQSGWSQLSSGGVQWIARVCAASRSSRLALLCASNPHAALSESTLVDDGWAAPPREHPWVSFGRDLTDFPVENAVRRVDALDPLASSLPRELIADERPPVLRALAGLAWRSPGGRAQIAPILQRTEQGRAELDRLRAAAGVVDHTLSPVLRGRVVVESVMMSRVEEQMTAIETALARGDLESALRRLPAVAAEAAHPSHERRLGALATGVPSTAVARLAATLAGRPRVPRYVCEPWEGLAGELRASTQQLVGPDGERCDARIWLEIGADERVEQGAGRATRMMPSESLLAFGERVMKPRRMTMKPGGFWFA